MLMSGTDNHIAGVGVMSEQQGGDPERWNVPGHEGFLNHDVAAMSELLQDAGYHTLMSGKWHLGLRPENNPAARGFDRSFDLLLSTSNHYGWEPQFGENDYSNFFVRIPPLYTEDGKKYDVAANTTHDKQSFITSDFYTENLIKYRRERSDSNKDKPFFAYLPFSAPHWPLHCSKEDRDRYKGMCDDGPDALRLRRLENLKKLGIVAPDVTAHEHRVGRHDRLRAELLGAVEGVFRWHGR
ncbi:Fc.00g104010.m01.CDS01 [Cosmosporella sp. VM-42]